MFSALREKKSKWFVAKWCAVASCCALTAACAAMLSVCARASKRGRRAVPWRSFAKHIKEEEQQKMLDTTITRVAVGTPHRIERCAPVTVARIRVVQSRGQWPAARLLPNILTAARNASELTALLSNALDAVQVGVVACS